MRINAVAVLPSIQSAISIGSGRDAATRVKLDLYLTPEQIAMLTQMQDTEIILTMEVPTADELCSPIPTEPGGVA